MGLSWSRFKIFAMLFFPLFSQAEETLSFSKCIELIKSNNADIHAADQSLQSQFFLTEKVQGAYYPQLSGNIGYLQANPKPLSRNTDTSYSASLNLTQNIFNGFSDEAQINQNQSQVLISKAALQIIKINLSFDLKTSYANLLYAKENIKTSQDFYKRRQENFRMVELRFQSGHENRGSLLLSEAYLKQASLDILKAQNSQETTQSDLKKLIGLDHLNEKIDITEDLILNDPPAVEPAYRNLINSNPLYSQARARIELAHAGVQISKSGFYPSLSFTAMAGKTDDEFFPKQDQWSLGVNLSWPLFNGGRDYYAEKSALANWQAETFNLTALERSQISALKKAFAAFTEAVSELKVYEAFLQAARSRAEIARAKYNNGLLPFDQWDIIENDLIIKTKTYLLAKKDRTIAEASWEKAIGTGVIQ